MKQNLMLPIASLLLILLMTLHLTSDTIHARAGTPEAGGSTLVGVPVLALWLYGTLRLAERRSFFTDLLPHLTQLRERTGRPHWLVIDSEQMPAQGQQTPSVLQITARPNLLEASALADVNLLLATGNSPQQMIREFCQMTALPAPAMDPVSLHTGEVLGWRPQVRNAAPFRLRIQPRTR